MDSSNDTRSVSALIRSVPRLLALATACRLGVGLRGSVHVGQSAPIPGLAGVVGGWTDEL
ncbi:hypothetical protein AC579_4519 [Pseudocercospora musae]|uniref:Uncharacterized protein n=1 Tax=Pseudocercospora musae TaxID=113226 RepID=A0A139HZL5_9PEZI|nr:hypothetical protein AC579_4519 [Pseudocercospora musae]